MNRWVIVIYSLLLFLPIDLLAAEPQPLRIPKARAVNDSAHDYFSVLMQKALHKAANGRAVPALLPTREMAPERIVRELKAGRTIDIFWLGGSKARARDLLVVPIPLERGLIGYRQFIVRKDRVADFDAIKTLTDLANFKACVGTQWIDTGILQKANLPVVTSVGYENLFKQLVARRCDYFPRAIHEAKIEMTNRAADYPELVVYDSLMLHYPFAVYFFVRHEDKALAKWLKDGLEQMIDDGELLAHMQQHQHTKLAFPLKSSAHQRLLLIPNDNLPEVVDYKNPRYWFQPDDFAQ